MKDFGLIFVRGNDPISKMTMKISGYNYSSVGFFYPSTLTGDGEHMVMLIDIFGMATPSWMHQNYTLNKLMSNDLISKIAIRELLPILNQDLTINNVKTLKLQNCFRTALTSIINIEELTLQESIYNLFDFHSEKTSVKKIEEIIYTFLNYFHGNNLSNLLNLLNISNLPSNLPNLSELLDLNNTVNTVNTVSKCPATITSLFNINRETFDELKIIMNREETIVVNLPDYSLYLNKIIMTIINEMISNREFFDIVTNRISLSEDSKSLKDLLRSMCQYNIDLINILNQSSEKGTLNIDQLKTIFDQVSICIKSLVNSSLELDHFQLIPFNFERRDYLKINNILPLKIPSNISHNTPLGLSFLNETISSILNSVNQGRPPIIHIQKLIIAANLLNDGSFPPWVSPFSEKSYSSIVVFPSKDIPNENISDAVINNEVMSGEVISGETINNEVISDETIPLEKTSSDEIIIPSHGADLSRFTLNQLYELMFALNEIASTTEHPLNSLRNEVSFKIANFLV
jgi:hypothetical protein